MVLYCTELLSLGTSPPPSLRTYLQAAARAAAPSSALHLLDLLWKVLEQCGDHLAAAEVLEGLATRPGSVLSLSTRFNVPCLRHINSSSNTLVLVSRTYPDSISVGQYFL